MREIELKVRVTDTQNLESAIKEAGVTLSQPKKQHDVVYSRPNAVDNDPEENWLRVRTENDSTVYFTLKRSVTGEQDSIEHETIVDSEAEITSIIKYLGFELYSDLTKIRRTGHLGYIELCLDEVPRLGTFIEAEKLCADDADYDMVAEELWSVLEDLGLGRGDLETHGYDVLMRQLETKS